MRGPTSSLTLEARIISSNTGASPLRPSRQLSLRVFCERFFAKSFSFVPLLFGTRDSDFKLKMSVGIINAKGEYGQAVLGRLSKEIIEFFLGQK